MKKQIFAPLLVALALLCSVALGDASVATPTAPQAQVIAQTIADLNGDGAEETVTLTGIQLPDSSACQDVTLAIADGASGETAEYPLPQDIGYGPQLWVGSLTAPNSRDVLVSMSSGGSGGLNYYTVFARQQEGYGIVFDTESYNNAFAYSVAYQDGYTVRADSLANGMSYHLSLSGREDGYLSDLYLEGGALKAPVAGGVNPLGFLYPADLDGDGVCEMIAFQRITGLYNADGLGNFVNTLAWDGESATFALRDQCVQISGAQQPEATP